ncbi:MAG: polysaccharide biosynthesis/export family protein [Bacteroidia bacterium]|nr:polysaccharide biosynthesis/export family protein [Bacteroidia bacterium]
MLNTCKITIFFLLFTLFFSCKTRKDLLYLQDIKDLEVLDVPGPSPEYRIKPDDNLYVNIQTVNPVINQLFNPSQGTTGSGGTQQTFGSPASSYISGYAVDLTGAITLPVIGTVTVVGKTVIETQAFIQQKANVYLKDASVQVKILNFKVTLLGELRNPGVYNNYSSNMTVLEAIGMAGGVTENAQISQLLVVRRTPTGSKSYRLDLSKKKLLASEAYFLQPNDVIYVNADRMKNIRLTMPTYSFILSAVTTIMLMLQYFRY